MERARSTGSGGEEAAPGSEMVIRTSGVMEEYCTSTPVYKDPPYAYCSQSDLASV